MGDTNTELEEEPMSESMRDRIARVVRQAGDDYYASTPRGEDTYDESDVITDALLAAFPWLADEPRAAEVEAGRCPVISSDMNQGVGWYEVIHPTTATTEIVAVMEDGSIYCPSGVVTPGEFAFAAARGNAHRMVRADALHEVALSLVGKAWDDGNGSGLDGWVGPGRGSGEVDVEAQHARTRFVHKADREMQEKWR